MQKIFDVNNKEDMDLLWSILPDKVERIKKNEPNTEYCVYLYSDSVLFINTMLKIDWHDKTEITRPVNYEDMIGCVGWFENEERYKKIGILTKVTESDENGYVFCRDCALWYKYFTPAKKSELKFYGD